MKDDTWNGNGNETETETETEIEIEIKRSVLLEILFLLKKQSVAFQNYNIFYYQYREGISKLQSRFNNDSGIDSCLFTGTGNDR